MRTTSGPRHGLPRVGPILILAAVLPLAIACDVETEADEEGEHLQVEASEDVEEGIEEAGEDLEDAGDQIREDLREVGEEVSVETEKLGEELEPLVEDAELTARVKARLTAHPDINPLHIDVTTVDATVTLTGKVPSEGDRDAALEIARNTEGVAEVVDSLEIGPRD